MATIGTHFVVGYNRDDVKFERSELIGFERSRGIRGLTSVKIVD